MKNNHVPIVAQSWRITVGMQKVLQQFVEGKPVLELGGSDGNFANYLVRECKAKRVHVIEKDHDIAIARRKAPLKNVAFFWGYLEQYIERCGTNPWPVVVCSWPINNECFCRDAVKLIRKAQHVIVLAKNDGVTACGTSTLWKHLLLRERVANIPAEHNDLIVYGPRDRPPMQEETPTEKFGFDYDKCLTT